MASSDQNVESTREKWSYYVVGGDERIVNSDELDVISHQGDPRDQTADPSETWHVKDQRTEIADGGTKSPIR